MSGDRWRAIGWYHTPASEIHLLSIIGSLGAVNSRARLAWRGMRSIDYDCISSLHRTIPGASEPELREREEKVLEEAREWGLGYGPGGWLSDLQLLADLQHFGTSTRLIDVTSDPMTALWFACQDVTEDNVSRSGVLLAMDTSRWKRFGRSMPHATRSAVNDPLGWELKEALNSREPFVVEALNPNERLRAQNGYFVASRVPENSSSDSPFPSLGIEYGAAPHGFRASLNGPSPTPLPRFPFIALRVRDEWKVRLLRILENSYNRRASVLFPDWTGFRDLSISAVPRVSEEETDALGKRRRR
jgi:hypothetical protein